MSKYLFNKVADLFVHLFSVVFHSHLVSFLHFSKHILNFPCPPHLVSSQYHHSLILHHPVNSGEKKKTSKMLPESNINIKELFPKGFALRPYMIGQVSKPIRFKTKTNRDLVTHVSPRFFTTLSNFRFNWPLCEKKTLHLRNKQGRRRLRTPVFFFFFISSKLSGTLRK